jgi:diguanylate cyclase (GGDEF)-like protein
MLVDAATLTLAGGFVTFLGGVFLLAYWWLDRKAWTAFWWGLANCGLGVGISLLALHSVLPFYVSHILAPMLLEFCAALTFVAARVFNRGSINFYRVVPCVAVLMTVMAITGGSMREQFAAALGVAASGALYAATAFQFWLGRAERLPGRRPLIGIIAAYAIALFMLALQNATTIDYNPVPPLDWLGSIQIIGLGYTLGVALFLTMLLKGRNEEKYRAAAFIDPLTGLSNRRAFMERGQRVFDRAGQDARPVALIAFDLDRFKRINDTFGHAAGDHVLRTFAAALAGALRPDDIAARIGGDEFVAVLPGVGDDAAVAVAGRICEVFQKAAQFMDGQKIEATVSAGVATTGGRSGSVAEALVCADDALYRAKKAGRNRIAIGDNESDGSGRNNVIRIA